MSAFGFSGTASRAHATAPANAPRTLTFRPHPSAFPSAPQTREGAYVEALVELVDMSCQPPQYGITLVQQPPTPTANGSGGHLRFTEGPRLFARSAGPALVAHAQRQQQLEARKRERQQQLQYQQPPFRAHCPACRAPLSLSDARALCSEAVASWEAERTRAWLRANDVIACPHPGCGALIQRVRPQGPGVPPSPPKPPPGASPRAAQASLAAAHREAHRYRCSACTRDFCDTCLAAPYHVGLTCAQALAPDCFLCGGKVGERRLEELLPKAAEAAAGEGRGAGGHSGRAGQRRAGAGPSGSGVVAMEVGEGGEAEGGGGEGGGGGRAAVEAARAAAAALVRRATKTELVACLKRLEVDTRWCLERRDLERVRAVRTHIQNRTCCHLFCPLCLVRYVPTSTSCAGHVAACSAPCAPSFYTNGTVPYLLPPVLPLCVLPPCARSSNSPPHAVALPHACICTR